MKEQNRLFVHDWEYYGGSHSVIIQKNFMPLKLQKFSIWTYRSFYRKTILHWLKRIGYALKRERSKYRLQKLTEQTQEMQ